MVDTIKIPAEELVDGDTFTLKTLTRGTITGIICGHPTIFRKEVHLKYVTLHDDKYKYLTLDLGEEVEVDELKRKLRESLEKQKQGPQPTLEDQYKQTMQMNGWRSLMSADGKRKLVWGDDDQLTEVELKEDERGPNLVEHLRKSGYVTDKPFLENAELSYTAYQIVGVKAISGPLVKITHPDPDVMTEFERLLTDQGEEHD